MPLVLDLFFLYLFISLVIYFCGVESLLPRTQEQAFPVSFAFTENVLRRQNESLRLFLYYIIIIIINLKMD